MVKNIQKEDTGLQTYYAPPDPEINIIAIHGMGAHPDDTWAENLEKDKSLPRKNVNWLKDKHMLPSVVPNARISRFGYRSQWFGGDDIQTGPVDLTSIAERLLSELIKHKEENDEKPLIFIAHSFGGLVLIKALRESFENPDKWPNILSLTVGLIFLGAPFRGREGMSIKDMIKAAVQGIRPDQVWPESLEHSLPGNEYLRTIVKKFTDMRERDYPIPLWCFYENLPSNVGKVVGGSPRLLKVITEESACLDQSTGIHRHPLERHHYNLNAFGRPKEEGYIKMCDVIQNIIKEAPQTLQRRRDKLEQEHWQRNNLDHEHGRRQLRIDSINSYLSSHKPPPSKVLELLFLKSDIALGSLIDDLGTPHQDALVPPIPLLEGRHFTKRRHENIKSFLDYRMGGTFRSFLSQLLPLLNRYKPSSRFNPSEFEGWTYELKQPKALFRYLCGIKDVRTWLEEGIEGGKPSYFIIGYHILVETDKQSTKSSSSSPIKRNRARFASIGDADIASDATILSNEASSSRHRLDRVDSGGPEERVYAICYRRVSFKYSARSNSGSPSIGSKNRWKMASDLRAENEVEEIVEADLDEEYELNEIGNEQDCEEILNMIQSGWRG